MDHGIGGAANSAKRADRVLQGFTSQDPAWPQIFADHLNDPSPPLLRRPYDGESRSREYCTCRLASFPIASDNAVMVDGRTHLVACTVGTRKCNAPIGASPDRPACQPGSHPNTSKRRCRELIGWPRQWPTAFGARRKLQGRNITAGSGHQLRRSGLVATAQQDHTVDGIGADGFPQCPSTQGFGRASRTA